jgi:hypothetical protein
MAPGEKTTGLSGVSTRLSGVEKPTGQRSPALTEQRLGAPDMLQCAVWCTIRLSGAPPDYPVCRRELQIFLQRLFWSWGLYILHPTSHLKVWEPKQNTKAYSAHFQELKHPSA